MSGSLSVTPMPVFSMPRPARGHVLEVHMFLVIAAVVVHDAQQRNAVMRGGPQNARSVVEVAVALNVDADATVFLVGERGAHGRRSAVTDAVCALTADEVIRLVEVPQAQRPLTDE